jgi:hypothetical protein
MEEEQAGVSNQTGDQSIASIHETGTTKELGQIPSILVGSKRYTAVVEVLHLHFIRPPNVLPIGSRPQVVYIQCRRIRAFFIVCTWLLCFYRFLVAASCEAIRSCGPVLKIVEHGTLRAWR